MLVKMTLNVDGRYIVVDIDSQKFDTLKNIAYEADIEVELLKQEFVQQGLDNRLCGFCKKELVKVNNQPEIKNCPKCLNDIMNIIFKKVSLFSDM